MCECDSVYEAETVFSCLSLYIWASLCVLSCSRAISLGQVLAWVYEGLSPSVVPACAIMVLIISCLLSIIYLPWGVLSVWAARADTGCLIHYKSAQLTSQSLKQQCKTPSYVCATSSKNEFVRSINVLREAIHTWWFFQSSSELNSFFFFFFEN